MTESFYRDLFSIPRQTGGSKYNQLMDTSKLNRNIYQNSPTGGQDFYHNPRGNTAGERFGLGRIMRTNEMNEPYYQMRGGGFWSDFADGFKQGFSGVMDIASKVLPVAGGIKSLMGGKRRKRNKHRGRGSDFRAPSRRLYIGDARPDFRGNF